jgi:CubicO group peptidase (beta-lactamase class C family)
VDRSRVAELLGAWSPDAALARLDASGAEMAVERWGPTDLPVPLASVTKPVVALACWIALEEGSWSLTEPAGPAGSTVEHLLCHASGLPFDGADPIAAPGVRRIYSNTGFEQLTDHLEARTGIPWARYVTDAVLEPLGMADTRLGPSSAKDATSTVEDLLRLVGELAAPRLVHPPTLSDATTPHLADLDGVVPGFGTQRPCPWGLGVEIKGTKQPHWTPTRASVRTFGHFGAAGTFVWFDPDSRLGAVGLGTRDFGPWAADLWPVLGDALLD